jgi:hypothetical protein
MTANWSKAAASKIIVAQPVNYTGSGTAFTTNFSPQTYQIRVISQISGWVAVLQSTATMFSTSTFLGQSGGPSGTFIAANTANGDYFACNPGQILGFTSTSTSSGTSPILSVTELF